MGRFKPIAIASVATNISVSPSLNLRASSCLTSGDKLPYKTETLWYFESLDFIFKTSVRLKAIRAVPFLISLKFTAFFIIWSEFFLWNLKVLIWNLELAKKRLQMKLNSATKLSLAMSSSRPIFKTLLSTAILETAWQNAIDASMKAINVMWSTIDKMSSDLTDKAIQSNRKVEEMASKPVLDTQKFIENVEKLKQHFDTIEEYREQVKKEAEQERELFQKATVDLENMKTWDQNDFQELKEELVQK